MIQGFLFNWISDFFLLGYRSLTQIRGGKAGKSFAVQIPYSKINDLLFFLFQSNANNPRCINKATGI